ncbi:hypothetical protein EVAR_40165_1 [Eumeta japonica]|uniref:Uncharacterized protein n=1 Tax=Eumeta variegata TaxID=151549 RepID=A0A4C1YJ19_EUMVA|nr:hypothetical protein EVAR_40165_1 [Eumeta japonica]
MRLGYIVCGAHTSSTGFGIMETRPSTFATMILYFWNRTSEDTNLAAHLPRESFNRPNQTCEAATFGDSGRNGRTNIDKGHRLFDQVRTSLRN